MIRQGLSTHADNVVTGASGERSAYLEAGGEDQAVDLILLTVGHHAALGQTLDAVSPCVDQGDVRTIVGLQIFVVEAWPLAELPVPGFQRRRRDRVLDDGVDPRADLAHLLVVGQRGQFSPLLRGYRTTQLFRCLSRGDTRQITEDIGPSVMHQVLVGVAAGLVGGEVFQPAQLPAGGGDLGEPVGIDRLVGAHVDGGGGALEDEEFLGRLGQVRDALHGGGAGADDADPLVL